VVPSDRGIFDSTERHADAKIRRSAESSADRAAGFAEALVGRARAHTGEQPMAAKKAARKSASRSAARKSAKSSRPAEKAGSKSARGAASRKKAVKAIPAGYTSVTPYLIINGAGRAIDFYKRAFGATEMVRMPMPDGRVGHAELKIGNAVVMMADEFPERGHKSPSTLGGTSGSILLYVPDVDSMFAQAIRAGAREVMPVIDQFYGDRSGFIEDPFGHQWTIATHTEDVSPQEMERRMKAMQ
jgi:PhnB protein